MRVLRLQPESPASPTASVVVLFDHPIAPKLEETISADRALRISPAVRAHIYWRDPSTIVADFDSAWAAGATYEVRLDPALRGVGGIPIAAMPMRVQVQMPRALQVLSDARDVPPDTVVHPAVLYSQGFNLDALRGHAWLVPLVACGTDSLPLSVLGMRRTEPQDSYMMRHGPAATDSLHRVVELEVPRTLPRGCRAEVHVPLVVGQKEVARTAFTVRPAFVVWRTICDRPACPRAQITITFSNDVAPDEVAAHVRINGRPVRVSSEGPTTQVVLLDSVRPRRTDTITVSGSLRNTRGEPLRTDATFTVTGAAAPPGVGFTAKVIAQPRDAAMLLAVRHVNTDSIHVIIARVPDSLHARALQPYQEYSRNAEWSSVVRDSVVVAIATPAPRDSERVVNVPVTAIPRQWRDDPLLRVRVDYVETIERPRLDTLQDVVTVNPRGNRVTRMKPIKISAIAYEDLVPRYAVIVRSNIAAHAVVSDNIVDAWVTGLRDARPRAGASIRVLGDSGRVFGTGVTDALGRAHIVGETIKRAFTGSARTLEVTLGADRTALLLPRQEADVLGDDDSAESRWGYGQGRNPRRVRERYLHGSAYTERGIYRPAETVYMSGAVRTFAPAEGYRVVSGDSVRWTITRWGDNGSEQVWSHVGLLSEFGTAADSFALPRTSRPGYFGVSLALRVDGGWRSTTGTSFQVAEYRAPEFAVKLDADTTVHLFAGDTAVATVNARYLFGVPMAGGTFEWVADVNENEGWYQVPALKGFTVGRWYGNGNGPQQDRTREGKGTLAADGTGRLRIAVPAITHPGVLNINVTVADANRQDVTRSISLAVHAADAYLGIRTRGARWISQPKDTIAVELLAARVDGTLRTGDTITVRAERQRWIRNAIVRDTVWSATVVSGATPVTAKFVPREGGSYEIIGKLHDERGRIAESSTYSYVTGGDYPWARPDPRAITLRSDRTRYTPGDVASIAVEAAHEERAWITVRHEGVLAEQFVTLHPGINALSIPLPATAVPAAQIQVRAVRAFGPGPGADTAGIYFRSGAITVEVDDSSATLHVAVAPEHARYQPRDSVRVNIDVRDNKGMGRAAEAAVWAVDEGVLTLTDYVRPAITAGLLSASQDNPWAGSTLLAWMSYTAPAVPPEGYWRGLYGRTAGNGSTSVMLRGATSYLAQSVVTATAMDQPAASPAADDELRAVFATTAFFAGHVKTDANGHASTSFRLPDNIGSYRIFAVAVARGIASGSADTSIITTRPLVVRAALPRIVRAGDELFAGAVLTKDDQSRTPVSLSVQATNAIVTGDATVRDTLDAQHSRELRFPLRITGGDSVSFIFRGASLAGAPMSDAVQARLAVSPPGRARAFVTTGLLGRSADATLVVPEGVDTLRSHVTLQLGASPLPLVRQFAEALRIYPYYCTEQVSSAGRALLARLDLERSLDNSVSMSARDRAQLETAVATLLNRQARNGSFGYWSAENWTTPWLTAYAAEFLAHAQRAGIDVPKGNLTRARDYLATTKQAFRPMETNREFAWSDSANWPREALAAAIALRRFDAPNTPLEEQIWNLRDKLGFEDRLSLAILLSDAKDTTRARAMLHTAWTYAHLDGRRVTLDDSASARRWLFRSVARPIALLLNATTRIEPSHPQLGALFESVVQAGRAETSRWWNTLDQAAVAEALTVASTSMRIAEERTISVAGTRGAVGSVRIARGSTDSLTPSFVSLVRQDAKGATVRASLSSTTTAPTYYAMTLFEVPTARPQRADDEGISVERWYESYDGGKPIQEVREGELVRVRLRITVPRDREFVVIDDALPAGLEAVDLSLRTSGSLPPFAGAPKLAGDMNESPPGQRWLYGAWDAGWWTPWEHKEIRDDRVLYFARELWKGSYQASYVARATTAGTFVRPPAQAEEMYNPAVRGRSDGGTFTVTRR